MLGGGSGGSVGDGSADSGICAGTSSVAITGTVGTIFDATINGNEIYSVYCNPDGTLNVYYTDPDTPNTGSMLNAGGVVITCN